MPSRSKTAGPGRAAHVAAALAALLLAAAPLALAQAQVTPPDPATRAAMDKRAAARTLLASALARIAANANDTAALLDAGRASIELEDYRAALGFLTRAEQANPRDGAVKAAMGAAMVHLENPTRALAYFGEAQLLGAPERIFLADRGLARDLLGQQDAAQRDYQLALSIAPNDETVRRYALSLGIAGEADRGVQLLAGQLRAQDRAAWRLRAMILAINSRNDEATAIVNATMPPQLAQNILPYLTQMNRLNPAQQAAAAHFGRFPSGDLGPPRAPVRVAAATPPPPAAAAAKPDRRRTSERARARGTLSPASATPPAVSVRREPDPAPVAVPPRQAPTVAVASTSPAPVRAAPAPTPTPTPAPTPAPTLAPTPAPAPAPAAASVAGTSTLPAAIRPAPATPPPPAAATSAPIGVAIRDSGPVGPGFSIADIDRPASAATPGPATAAVTPAATAAASAAPAAPLASLADIIGSLEIPPEELARPSGAVDAATLARLQDEKRKAEAAAEAKREKDAAAAKAKAEADAKAKAEADAKKAHPARQWVQIATGANPKALAFDYNRFAKRNAALFKGKAGATAEWGQTRRLLVGPFASRKAAQAWLDDYKKAEGDGFLFNSAAGETVESIK